MSSDKTWTIGLPIDKKYIGFLDLLNYKISSIFGPYFNYLGISPNIITLLGLCGNLLYAYFIYHKIPLYFLFIIPMVLDCMDGYNARRFDKGSKYGTMLDHYSDWISAITIFISAGLRYRYHKNGIPLLISFIYLEYMNLNYSSLLQEYKGHEDVELTKLFVTQTTSKSSMIKKLEKYKNYNSSTIGYLSILLFYYLHYSS